MHATVNISLIHMNLQITRILKAKKDIVSHSTHMVYGMMTLQSALHSVSASPRRLWD
jgi:hypothetical protein